MYKHFFKEKPKKEELDIPSRPRYKTAYKFEPLREAQLRKQIDKLAPHKAPGPNGIPNILIKQCKDVLIHHLLSLYRASFKLNWYPKEWKESKTVVIRKPGKGNYHLTKAYRCYAGSLMTREGADRLSTEHAI